MVRIFICSSNLSRSTIAPQSHQSRTLKMMICSMKTMYWTQSLSMTKMNASSCSSCLSSFCYASWTSSCGAHFSFCSTSLFHADHDHHRLLSRTGSLSNLLPPPPRCCPNTNRPLGPDIGDQEHPRSNSGSFRELQGSITACTDLNVLK